MPSVNTLRSSGANVQEGLERCINDEGFYLEMVNMALDDANFAALADAAAAGDKKATFEAAHALKGILANVALKPLQVMASDITERLRAMEDADYPALVGELLRARAGFLSLRDN